MAKSKRAKPENLMTPKLSYVASGAATKVAAIKEKWRREWEHRIGTDFPGFGLDAIERLASAADIPFEVYEHLTAGEVYRLAIDALDPRPPVAAAEQVVLPVVRLDPPEIEHRGKVFQVSSDVALAFQAMVEKHPERVGLTPVIGAHPERKLAKMPLELKSIVDTNGKGSSLILS